MSTAQPTAEKLEAANLALTSVQEPALAYIPKGNEMVYEPPASDALQPPSQESQNFGYMRGGGLIGCCEFLCCFAICWESMIYFHPKFTLVEESYD
ncbi:hypothetical protein B7494_g851 [Chlorociboria aeruginascens]|nr:hypothetical protein B7494_g851 [Chlorociboria aeruginascens]